MQGKAIRALITMLSHAGVTLTVVFLLTRFFSKLTDTMTLIQNELIMMRWSANACTKLKLYVHLVLIT